jgi:RNA polymerase sigma-70 factor (ECF subfamily)
MASLTLITQDQRPHDRGRSVGALERLPDEHLMLLVKNGHVRAFDVLMRRHRAAVMSLARYTCGPDLADDVVQAAFVSLWQQRDKYSSDRGNPRSWLLAMTRNRAIDQLRSRASRQRHSVSLDPHGWIGLADDGPTGEPVHSQLERAEIGAAVRGMLSQLPPAQRSVIELSYFDGLSQQQIADCLSVPLGTVKGRMRLGLEKLRDAWAHGEANEAALALIAVA